MAPGPALLPLTVIGGYLGAGKTTLLNEMLANPRGRRYAVIVNDLGEVSVDAELVAAADGDVVTLSNGCVCCSAGAGFADALDTVRDLDVDHVLVEVSGVGDPWKVAQWGRTPGFVLDAVVTLADAETIRDRARDRYVGDTVVSQLRGADAVVVTRVDVAPPDTVAAVAGWISDLTDAPVLCPPRGARTVVDMLSAGERRHDLPDAHDGHAAHVQRTFAPPIRARDEWLQWLAGAPAGVVRVKGFAAVDGTFLRIDLSGRRREVTRWRGADPRPAIVAIATPEVDVVAFDEWCRA